MAMASPQATGCSQLWSSGHTHAPILRSLSPKIEIPRNKYRLQQRKSTSRSVRPLCCLLLPHMPLLPPAKSCVLFAQRLNTYLRAQNSFPFNLYLESLRLVYPAATFLNPDNENYITVRLTEWHDSELIVLPLTSWFSSHRELDKLLFDSYAIWTSFGSACW